MWRHFKVKSYIFLYYSGTWIDPGVSVCVSSVRGAWPAEWTHGASMKRNMVVADDAAFREKSKLLTSMERQKWLNSYMQKLLVVNSS